MVRKPTTRAPLPIFPATADSFATPDPLLIPGMPKGPLPTIPKRPVVLSSLVPISPRTGRKLVLLARDGVAEGESVMASRAGFKVVDVRDVDTSFLASALDDGQAIAFRSLGVAVCSGADPERLARVEQAVGGSSPLRATENERYVFQASMSPAWLRGYRAAVDHLADNLLDGGLEPGDGPTDLAAAAQRGAEDMTWGLGAILASNARFTGRDIKIAVLDTGIDPDHPDLRGRLALGRGFAGAQDDFADRNGHGTHCAGVAAGPASPHAGIGRYGVATGALLHVGKVLDDLGQGVDAHILAGIAWALEENCRVISMSLGAPVGFGEAPSRLYEQVGRRARTRGAVIIAAAGNDSDRPNLVAPVSHPANCASIMAVGAVDRQFSVARFSNSGLTAGGGAVDLVAPGVGVLSAWPGARQYRQESGTSMAAPHVAGVAAMLLEAEPGLNGDGLFAKICASTRKLKHLKEEDVGAGLVQAPP